jgi:hypothetical protein
MFLLVVLGRGDTEWVACALGKDNMVGAHCNHCRRSNKDFHLVRGELWTLESIATMSQTFRDEILPAAAGRKNKPNTGYNGVKHPSTFAIHLWVSPVLHYKLGIVKDWLTRVEKLCDTRIETLPNDEVDSHEHLVILGDSMLVDDLLMEQEDLSPKETIKEFENHLKATKKELQRRDIQIPHETTGVLITVPGRVSPEEQQLISKLVWEIESCKQQSTELQKEIKTTKEMIEKKKKQLQELRSERDCL